MKTSIFETQKKKIIKKKKSLELIEDSTKMLTKKKIIWKKPSFLLQKKIDKKLLFSKKSRKIQLKSDHMCLKMMHFLFDQSLWFKDTARVPNNEEKKNVAKWTERWNVHWKKKVQKKNIVTCCCENQFPQWKCDGRRACEQMARRRNGSKKKWRVSTVDVRKTCVNVTTTRTNFSKWFAYDSYSCCENVY